MIQSTCNIGRSIIFPVESRARWVSITIRAFNATYELMDPTGKCIRAESNDKIRWLLTYCRTTNGTQSVHQRSFEQLGHCRALHSCVAFITHCAISQEDCFSCQLLAAGNNTGFIAGPYTLYLQTNTTTDYGCWVQARVSTSLQINFGYTLSQNSDYPSSQPFSGSETSSLQSAHEIPGVWLTCFIFGGFSNMKHGRQTPGISRADCTHTWR